ncbi:hypothetical protein Ocin01_17243 [Orchesella cincta]|uniref:Uncharacterized protein n=1 Tax=Orchesella cincta TaxID=48709 RepID=A0A1D2M8Z5_ORCCI|nr:hypothetical protein Ocin01_17243 [Orchesella cincta]
MHPSVIIPTNQNLPILIVSSCHIFLQITSVMNRKNVFLFIETPFNLTFKQEGVADQDANCGNKRVSANGSRTFELMSTSALAEQIKGNEDVDAGLRSCFRNVLGNRDEMSIHANTEVSWNLAFVSETSARVKFSVGGRFFEKFLTECQDSIKLKLMMGLTYGQHSPSFSIESFESHEMRPSCSTGTGCYFFEDEINVEVKQRFPMLRPVTIGRGRMTMLMVICRDVVLEDLPFKFAVMGQTILEDKIQSIFKSLRMTTLDLAATKSFWLIPVKLGQECFK